MVTRIVKAVLEAESSPLVRGFNEANRAIEQTASNLDGLGGHISKDEKAFTTAGATLAGFGAATAGALVVSAKAAIDWESSFAGVMKTVDDSAEGYAELNSELRGMARELPTSHAEIAGVAEAAGQLGVARGDITDFTATMVDLGETTNLTAEEAATSIAQMTNVMGTSNDEVDNLGSALVALGNNSATTEAQILFMAQGMAGAAATVGLAESDVLGLAAATSSMGIEVQAGGTAVSRTLTDMSKAAATGSEELALFADVAGMSADEFATAFREDPAEAFAAFIGGLGDMQTAGEEVFTVLDDLGQSDVRVSRALLGMASAGDLLTDSLELGSKAWAENTALTDEAALRYGTTASQLKVAKNNASDAAISFGEVLMPAVAGASGAVSDFAGWLSDLPDPIQEVTVGVGSIVSVVGLMGGGLLLALPRINDTISAFRTLRASAGPAAAGIRAVSQAALGLTALMILAEINDAVDSWTARNDDLEQLGEAIADVGSAAEMAETQVAWMTRSGALGQEQTIEGAEALDRLAESAQIAFGDDIWDKLGRVQTPGSFDRFIEDASALDVVLAQMVRDGNVEGAADIFEDFIARTAELDGVDLEEVTAGFENYEVAVKEANEAQQEMMAEQAVAWDNVDFPDLKEQATDLDRLTAEHQANAEATEAMAEAYRSWLDEMGGASASFASIGDALANTQGAAQEWAQEQADATETADDSWEDFYDGFSIDLDKYLDELQEMADAQANWQTNMSSLVGKVSDETLDHLARLGPEGAPLVAALVDGTAEELAEFDSLFNSTGQAAGEEWADGLAQAQALFRAAARELGDETAAEILEAVRSGEMSVAEAVLEWDLQAQIEVDANDDQAAATIAETVADIETITAVAKVDADTGLAIGSSDNWADYTDGLNPKPEVDAETNPADSKSDQWYGRTHDMRPVPEVDADASDAYGEVDDWNAWAENQAATIKTYADTADLYGGVRNAMSWIAGLRPVMRVGMSQLALASGGGVPQGYEQLHHAGAGEVHGPGTSTSDSINAKLSDDEHVWSAREVHSAGGHSAMYGLRKLAVTGQLRSILGYNVGGEAGAPTDYRVAMQAVEPRFTPPAPVVQLVGASGSGGGTSVQVDATITHPVDLDAFGRKIAWELG